MTAPLELVLTVQHAERLFFLIAPRSVLLHVTAWEVPQQTLCLAAHTSDIPARLRMTRTADGEGATHAAAGLTRLACLSEILVALAQAIQHPTPVL